MVLAVKIIAISDTHITALDDLEQKTIDRLSKADMILHAGDYTGTQLVRDLKELTRFKGVYGNMDPAALKAELKPIEVIEEAGFRIGLTHPGEGGNPLSLPHRLRPILKDVDIVVYGHSHKAKREQIEGALYINPGSLTGAFPALRKTYAEIRLGDKIEVELITL